MNQYNIKTWTRCVVCVDMNAFFASIEQQKNPSLRGCPVAVTNGVRGSCIITSSYEARRWGIKTGMHFAQAKRLCPNLIQCASRPEIYAAISKKLMALLCDEFSPDIEVFSVDEAFLDMTRIRCAPSCPYQLAHAIQNRIKQVLGLPASVGVAADKTMSKYAAKRNKPLGVFVIDPSGYQAILASLPVQELCGIGPRIRRYLSRYGVHTCGAVAKLPASLLSRRWGCYGQRLWLMCAGKDPDPVRVNKKPSQSMGHGKVLPPGSRGYDQLSFYLHHMALKLTKRLQQHGLYSSRYRIGFLSDHSGWQVFDYSIPQPTHAYLVLAGLIKKTLSVSCLHGVMIQVQVTAWAVTQVKQLDFYAQMQKQQAMLKKTSALLGVVKSIQEKFGTASVVPTRLLKPLSSPDVIAPAWKPDGARQTITLTQDA